MREIGLIVYLAEHWCAVEDLAAVLALLTGEEDLNNLHGDWKKKDKKYVFKRNHKKILVKQ